ncbi:unnamed protein product, partial [Sphenostylis stenocarpa]
MGRKVGERIKERGPVGCKTRGTHVGLRVGGIEMPRECGPFALVIGHLKQESSLILKRNICQPGKQNFAKRKKEYRT